MAVLDRAELEASPLADLHAIAREMGIDGYRLLPREELITAILAGGAVTARDLRERAAAVRDDDLEPLEATAKPRRRSSRKRGGERQREAKQPEREGGLKGGEVIEGKLALRAKGGGELQVQRDGRTYKVLIAPSQIKRFELKEGDKVAGPIRRRKGQGFALVRVERINGVAAEEAVAPPQQERRKAGPAFPERLLSLPGSDALIGEVEALAPLGFGSRALIVGPTRSGKSELLLRLAKGLAGAKEPAPVVVLCGVRPEELAQWRELGVELAAELTLDAPVKERLAALQAALSAAEQRRRQGQHVAVLIDTLDGLEAEQCRQILAKARNEAGSGSLTVVATARQPFGGETTVIALRPDLERPQLDPVHSGTLKVELLVGPQRAAEIARTRQRLLKRRRSLLARLFGR